MSYTVAAVFRAVTA